MNYVAADVPATSHAIDLVSTCGFGCARVVYVLLTSLGLPQSRGDVAIWGAKDENIASINFRYSSSRDASIAVSRVLWF